MLANRTKVDGVTVVSIHLGMVDTEMQVLLKTCPILFGQTDPQTPDSCVWQCIT